MLSVEEITALFDVSPIWLVIGAIFIINITITIIEMIVDYFSTTPRLWKDSAANIVIFFMGQVTEKVATGVIGVVALLPFYYLVPWEIPMNIWMFFLALIAADFTYYWMHRIEHEHRILWAFHSVHHSSQDYNLTIALRLSIVEGFIGWVFLIPMILIGFNPFMAIIALIFVVQYQTWIHTNRIKTLGILDRWFNTPSVHRVHHGSNPQYIDKNYAGILLIWDRMFGTYEPENEKVIYGLTKNIQTNNPIKINFIEFGNIWKDVKKCRNMKDKMKIIFGGLIWKPKYF
ncbi:MAG: sterol desaturase family protein [Xanthomonadales bacterium]|nr:sterol desaturase family protein [Xanthomonadales bacterium]